MPYCPECGEEVKENEAFCSNCGASLKGIEGTSQKTEGSPSGTSLDISENIEALISYFLFWVSGIVILILEEKNEFVRFHAKQSIITFLPLMILVMILRALGGTFLWMGGGLIFGGPLLFLSSLIVAGIFVLWLILMFKAYEGEKYKLPIAGNFAEKWEIGSL